MHINSFDLEFFSQLRLYEVWLNYYVVILSVYVKGHIW